MGHVLFPLESLDVTEPMDLWRDVEKSSQVSLGTIIAPCIVSEIPSFL